MNKSPNKRRQRKRNIVHKTKRTSKTMQTINLVTVEMMTIIKKQECVLVWVFFGLFKDTEKNNCNIITGVNK